MRRELHELLCARYPAIFRDRYGEKRTRAMRWCAECGDGWFVLIDTLCAEIQWYVGTRADEIAATKIKTFLGGLEFYYRDPSNPGRCLRDEYLYGLVGMADSISGSLCAISGAPVARKPRQAWPSIFTLVPSWPVNRVFALPPIKNPGWRHLAEGLEELIDLEMRFKRLPPVMVDHAIETENLAFRWYGGDDKGRTAGYFRMVEALSLRCDPASGRFHDRYG